MRSEVKQLFLQACLNHGSLSSEQISEILGPISQSYDDTAVLGDVKNLVKEINSDLKEFNQELKFVKHPLLGKEYLVFGLTFETPASKLQHHYREADQLYFAKLVEAMAFQEDYGISWVDMYNLPNLPQNVKKDLTKTRVQDLITKWTRQGYFVEKDDKIFFGPRMLVEYAFHLKTHFSDYIKDCPLCKNVVLWDIKCDRCEIKVHKECIRTFLKRKSNCPSCNEVWSTPLN
ncbi:non-structural maintenance of chromosomes element 1 homolog [Bactrocera oleae]|uniref:non-structural maintenance of chromosomes element 1 homolog n=1 Tax=Bactrocera oleae TaxID=104688 RepID=UPI00387E4C96